jgi:hypothetical protein
MFRLSLTGLIWSASFGCFNPISAHLSRYAKPRPWTPAEIARQSAIISPAIPGLGLPLRVCCAARAFQQVPSMWAAIWSRISSGSASQTSSGSAARRSSRSSMAFPSSGTGAGVLPSRQRIRRGIAFPQVGDGQRANRDRALRPLSCAAVEAVATGGIAEGLPGAAATAPLEGLSAPQAGRGGSDRHGALSVGSWASSARIPASRGPQLDTVIDLRAVSHRDIPWPEHRRLARSPNTARWHDPNAATRLRSSRPI